ncbi:MAG: hypothetical protein KDA70_17770 [Planctomycetaceae bacterium]|nr:hypothetical protein [Planctomycetaceae bacterium]
MSNQVGTTYCEMGSFFFRMAVRFQTTTVSAVDDPLEEVCTSEISSAGIDAALFSKVILSQFPAERLCLLLKQQLLCALTVQTVWHATALSVRF